MGPVPNLHAEVIAFAAGERHPSDDHVTTVDEAAIVSVIETLYTRVRNQRRWRQLAEWELNRAFFRDRAWAIWDDRKNALDIEPARPDKAKKRLQVNLFKSFVVTAAARIAATHPVILVAPGSRDQDAHEKAYVSQRYLEHEWNKQAMPERIARSVIPHMLDGTSVWAVEWDHHAGKIIGYTTLMGPDGRPKMDPTTGEPAQVPVHEGRPTTRRVRCHHFYLDPAAYEFDQAIWCMEATPRSTAWIYRETGKAVQPDGQWAQEEGFIGNDYSHGQITRTETATVKRFWLKPGRFRYGSAPHEEIFLPRGLYVAVAGGRIIEGPFENPYDEVRRQGMPGPYIFIPCLPHDETPWGESIFNSLRSPQVSLNKTWSQAVESNDYMAMPVWLLPAETELINADWNHSPGSVLRFDGTNTQFPPQRLDGKGAAAAVYRAIDLMIQAFQLISGLSEGGLLGNAPKNVESGVGLEVLTERDSSKLAITAMELGRGIQRWGMLQLGMARQFRTQDQLIAVTGISGQTEVHKFRGDMAAEDFEVRVVAESVMPQSRQARLQEALVLLKSGIITVEDARRRIAADEQTGEMTLDQRNADNARDENYQAETLGRIMTPIEHMMLEDHAIHIEEHMKALLKPQNRPGLAGIPAAWLALYAHIQAHQQLLWQEFMQGQQQQTSALGPGEAEPGMGGPNEGAAQPKAA